MRLKILFTIPLFLFICLPNKIHAQNDYREGYVITNTLDTVKGYLLYLTKGSKICTFKKSLSDNKIEYSTNDIVAFRYNDGKYFIAKELNIGNTNQKYFLEFLIKGKANIYFIRLDGDHYFIEKENEKIIELSERDTIINSVYGYDVFKFKQFKGKLKYTLRDCPEIYSEIDNLNSLTHSSLIGIVKDYHNKTCKTEECIIFESNVNTIKVKKSAYVGCILNKLNYGYTLISDYSLGSNIGYRFEFLNLIKWSDHISLMADLSLRWFKQYNLTQTDEIPNIISYNGKKYQLSLYSSGNVSERRNLSVNLKTIELNIPIVINKYFYVGKTRPYLGIGFENMFVISQNQDFVFERFVENYGHSVPFHNVGIIIKTGLKYDFANSNSIFIEMNYEITRTYENNEEYNLINNFYSFALGYGF